MTTMLAYISKQILSCDPQIFIARELCVQSKAHSRQRPEQGIKFKAKNKMRSTSVVRKRGVKLPRRGQDFHLKLPWGASSQGFQASRQHHWPWGNACG